MNRGRDWEMDKINHIFMHELSIAYNMSVNNYLIIDGFLGNGFWLVIREYVIAQMVIGVSLSDYWVMKSHTLCYIAQSYFFTLGRHENSQWLSPVPVGDIWFQRIPTKTFLLFNFFFKALIDVLWHAYKSKGTRRNKFAFRALVTTCCNRPTGHYHSVSGHGLNS